MVKFSQVENTLWKRAKDHMRKLQEKEEVLQACMGGDMECYEM